MFPFLAPIKTGESRIHYDAVSSRTVEIEFFVRPPRLSPRTRNLSGKSNGTNLSVSSHGSSLPNSRQKTKSPASLSQPSSSRSAKSSPIPPAPSEVPPPPSRHRNKGLETSSAMLEMFGGGISAFGAGSAFEKIPPMPETRNFGRKNMLAREMEEKSQWESVRNPVSSTAPLFDQIEDHEKAYAKITKHSHKRGREVSDQLAQPGPEVCTDADTLENEYELLPDPNCPAEKVLSGNTRSFDMEHVADLTSPESDGAWSEAREKVVPDSPDSSGSSNLLTSQPGPDLGDDEDVVEVGADGTSIAQSRRNSSEGRDSDGQGAEDAEARPNTGSSLGEDADNGGGGGDVMSLIIKAAHVVNDDSLFPADVLIQDGVITNVGVDLEVPPGAQIIEAAGRMLLPAGIDVHTQLTAPESADDVETGCKAALAGGTATLVEMVCPKSGESLSAAIARVRKALISANCNMALSVVVDSWSDAVKKEMEKSVADGVNSFVINVEKDEDLYQMFEFCRSLGAHARVLPENKSLIEVLEKKMLAMGITGPEGFLQSRPEELESQRVSSVCIMSQLTNCPVSIISVSSADSLASLEKARCSGALSHAEIATAAIASDGSHYFNKCLKHASAHMTEVPLRTEGTSKLVAALASQPLTVCTSGHRSVSSGSRLAAKDFTTMPKGSSGVEERMSVVWEKAVRTGRIDPMRFVAVTSSNAAKMFNMYPKKGRIAVGADADLVLWDTTTKRKLGVAEGQSSADVSIYEGFTVHSQAAVTIVGGHVAWKDGGLKDAKGSLVSLKPNSPYLFSVVQQRDKMGSAEKVEREPTTNGSVHKKSTGEPPRSAVRKSHFDSSIQFGTSDSRPATTRGRNPPGGRSTGFW